MINRLKWRKLLYFFSIELGHHVMKVTTEKGEDHLHYVSGNVMTTSSMRKFLYERVDGTRNSLGELT